ncbi:hypothetical protein NE237_030190 [Protea cynaroides]|uniref:Uncharacterized protein n=1 Tax=Protea cynaroides TaxID=273540 RepID=A0A9Q0JX05_9MAGN|nr:hypothetical protein NE237_030190 [Protea cynaroides]
MVRGKTQMKRIENATSRQVTFCKRRNGLLKKAFELSVLCDAEVGLIVFSPRGKLCEYSSSSMQRTVDRYQRLARGVQNNSKAIEQSIQNLKYEAASMAKEIEILEVPKRKLLGDELESCAIEELQQIESQLVQSLSNIRGRKTQLFKEQIEQLKEKERILKAENGRLREKAWRQATRNGEMGNAVSRAGALCVGDRQEPGTRKQKAGTPILYIKIGILPLVHAK